MPNYKDTLNLPQTDFPMKADLAKNEPTILEHWTTLNIYQQIRALREKCKKFVLHDGPPYANGPIHLGTGLNKILKDIVVKSKGFDGEDAPFLPGWDCHGLPIELQVEKKTGRAGDKLSRAEFRQACREYAKEQIARQSADFQRLGVFGDWGNPYLTMHYQYEADIIRSLSKIIEKGHLSRGVKPVHWCPSCGSALAEAEVEYVNKVSPAIDVAFVVVDPQKIWKIFSLDKFSDGMIIFPIWTTTPWTLIANQAVAVNPQLLYVLIKAKWRDQSLYFVVSQDLLDSIIERYQLNDVEVLSEIIGNKLENITLKHPFLDRIVPVICGSHVTTEMGTGCVHTAPVHGPDDYAVGLHYELPLDNPIDDKSCFFADIPVVGGLHVYKADKPIIEILLQRQMLLHEESLDHSYPHCWRHKKPVIFRATPQWFISMSQKKLRETALGAIEEVKWYPQWGRNRIHNMVADRPDWCISRQRIWGVPIPLFIHKKNNQLHPKTLQILESIADRVEKNGVEAWFSLNAQELLGEDEKDYNKSNDILDVWFESGCSHQCVLAKNPELHLPADLYLEGSDQHRGWFQTSLLTACAIRGDAPYKSVVTHGYVIERKGVKMSKSLGNVILPSEVIEKYGADILRLWVASADYRGDISFSDEIIKRLSDAYRRIRNTARFLLSNLYDFVPAQHEVAIEKMVALDRWAMHTTEQLQKNIIDAYHQYQFQTIYQLILNFCTVDMGGFYLDIIKDRLYTAKTDSVARRSAQTTLIIILQSLVRWLAPILSFTAEEIWQHMLIDREKSVFFATWFERFPRGEAEEAHLNWNFLRALRDAVNKLLEEQRASGNIGSALEAEIIIYAQGETLGQLQQIGEELRFLLITSSVQVCPFATKSERAHLFSELNIAVDVHRSDAEKCVRCWQHRKNIGENKQYPDICDRCIENISGDGEVRRYA